MYIILHVGFQGTHGSATSPTSGPMVSPIPTQMRVLWTGTVHCPSSDVSMWAWGQGDGSQETRLRMSPCQSLNQTTPRPFSREGTWRKPILEGLWVEKWISVTCLSQSCCRMWPLKLVQDPKEYPIFLRQANAVIPKIVAPIKPCPAHGQHAS